MSFTKKWYSKPIPPDMQFEERIFQTQFSIYADKLYKWNIDGLFEQKFMSHMSNVDIVYQNNHDLDQSDIVNLLVTDFSGTPNILPQVSDLMNNLRCSTVTNYRWHQDVFSRIILREDCHKPYWKERFIDDLPPVFVHKVKQVLMGKNNSLNYDNLTYDDIFSAIKKFCTSMCNNEKLLTYQLQN